MNILQKTKLLIKKWMRSYTNQRLLHLDFPADEIKPIIRANRELLESIPCWLTKDVYEHSLYKYGIPERLLDRLDHPTDNTITYSDIIVYFGKQLGQPLRYLELGVSAGKNFMQVASAFRDSEIWGLDIEEINPVLDERFDFMWQQKWPTKGGSIKIGDSTLRKYAMPQKNNHIYYLSADIFHREAWEKMSGKKFNIIFSDAFHSPDALRHEYQMIHKYQLLDESEFYLVWDDLTGPMEDSFNGIYEWMQKEEMSLVKKRYLTNGWANLMVHEIGVIQKSGAS